MKFDHLLSDYRRWGLLRAVSIRIMSVIRRYAGVHLYRVFVRPLASGHTPVEAHPQISMRIARPEELYKAAGGAELDLNPDFIRGALERGDTAFGAFDGEDIVAYGWRTCSSAPHADGLWVAVGAPYGYAYKAFTRESHRGRHLACALSFFGDTYSQEWGHTANLSFVELSNYSSLSLQRAKGGEAIGYVGYAKWFGCVFPFGSPGAKTVGLQLFLKQERKLWLALRKGAGLPATPAG